MNARRFRLFFLLALTIAGTTGISAQTEGAAIVARDEPAEGGRASASNVREYGSPTSTGRSTAKGGKTAKTTTVKTTNATKTVRPKPKAWNGFVVGDKYTFLNFEVVSAEKPWHTRDAKANGAKGLVQVEVLIDTNGNVIEAKGRTGNKLLHPEAERAALASKFNKPTFGGKPARAIGFLVYRFGEGDDD